MRVGEQLAGLAAGLVAVELQVRGTVAGEGEFRRPGARVVARQGLGQRGQQPLELGAGGQRRAVQAAGLMVGEAGGGPAVDQPRPEGFGEVGPIRPGGIFPAAGVVAVVLGQRVGLLPGGWQGEEGLAGLPEPGQLLRQRLAAGKQQIAVILELRRHVRATRRRRQKLIDPHRRPFYQPKIDR